MTPMQCRAARGLLDMTIEQLSEKAGVSYTCARAFEKGRNARPPQRERLRLALEDQGVEFISGQRSGVMIAVEKAA